MCCVRCLSFFPYLFNHFIKIISIIYPGGQNENPIRLERWLESCKINFSGIKCKDHAFGSKDQIGNQRVMALVKWLKKWHYLVNIIQNNDVTTYKDYISQR
jgi:hypothetical protein